MDTRRLIVFMLLAFTFIVSYQWIYNRMFPLPAAPPPATQNAEEPATEATAAWAPPVATRPAEGGAATQPGMSAAAPTAFQNAADRQPRTIGGEGHTLQVELSPRAASVSRVWITEKSKRHPERYAHTQRPRGNQPLELLAPVQAGSQAHHSFETRWLKVEEWNREFRLGDLVWQAVEHSPQRQVFTTELRDESGAGVLRLTKSYELREQPFLMGLTLRIENLSGAPLTPLLEQGGPIGIPNDDQARDVRKLMWARRVGGALEFKHAGRAELLKQQHDPRRLDGPAPTDRLVWVALVNKYFGAFVRPLSGPNQPDNIAKVTAAVAAPNVPGLHEDALAQFLIRPAAPLAPGAALETSFEAYFGPKDEDILARSNPAFIDRTQIGYIAAHDVDQSCCTFQPLPAVMLWLLETIYFFVRNYGVAIIIIVLIVRGLLHPLAVWQQKQMYRSQEAMARIQPKIEAIKEKYADDRVKMNQEIMRLWGEENVNPAAMLFTMLPLFLQLPIIVALWSAVSSDIHLRNAPFDGYWIQDLSSPDALIKFAEPFSIPLISLLTGPLHSLNVLPIIMGVTMYLQQKYMPKPSQVAKRELQRDGVQKKSSSGLSAEDQMRINQTTANLMCVLFPVMFYNMPSGLTLYWLATNVFGIFESLRIRKQIRQEKERREREGPQPPSARQPGMVARWFKYAAEKAEELQRQADDLSRKGDPAASRGGKGRRK